MASPLSTAPGEGISMKLVALWEFGDLRLQKIGRVVLRSPRSDSKATTPSTNEPMDDEIAKTWERAVSLIEAGTMSGYALYYKALEQALQSLLLVQIGTRKLQGQTICKIKPIKPIDV